MQDIATAKFTTTVYFMNNNDRFSALKQISTCPIRLEKLLFFWLAVFLPAIMLTNMLNYSWHERTEAARNIQADRLLDAMETLQHETAPENYFRQLILDAEQGSGMPPRNSKSWAGYA